MSDLLIIEREWNFEVVPEGLNDHFVEAVTNCYYTFLTHKDYQGVGDLPIFYDVAFNLNYYRVIESYVHSIADGVEFKDDYFYNKVIKHLTDEEEEKLDSVAERLYDDDIVIDTKKVLDTFHLSYQDSWNPRLRGYNVFPVLEVW